MPSRWAAGFCLALVTTALSACDSGSEPGEGGSEVRESATGKTEAPGQVGTADTDGDRAVIEIGGRTYDFGADGGTVYCGQASGITNAQSRPASDKGRTAGFEAIVYDVATYPSLPDPPYIWLIDDSEDVEYLAGPIPGRSSVDPGQSEVTSVQAANGTMTATATFIDRRGSTTELLPGTITVTCSQG